MSGEGRKSNHIIPMMTVAFTPTTIQNNCFHLFFVCGLSNMQHPLFQSCCIRFSARALNCLLTNCSYVKWLKFSRTILIISLAPIVIRTISVSSIAEEIVFCSSLSSNPSVRLPLFPKFSTIICLWFLLCFKVFSIIRTYLAYFLKASLLVYQSASILKLPYGLLGCVNCKD
ncbi:hypothetical protein D1872_216810 [compost metagenome]